MTKAELHALIREVLQEVITELPSGEFRLYSKKKNPKTGTRRNLGTFSSRAAAEEREKEVNRFKHMDETTEVEESFAMADPGVVGTTKKKKDAVCPPGTKWAEESGGLGHCVK